MKKSKTITETKTVTERFCDVCGLPANHHCRCCGKDLCGWMHLSHAIQDNSDGGSDYPDYYCSECWEIGVPFREKKYDLIEEAYEQDTLWFKKVKEMKKDGQK